jgi:2-phosphoglycerate kinase
VLLLGGASGTGKSELGYPVARRFGTPIVEVDDLVLAVQRMTTPAQQPMLHYWETHPDAGNLPVPRIVELQIAVAEALRPALEAVIGNHLETGTPVVIEGDYAGFVRRSACRRPGTSSVPPRARSRPAARQLPAPGTGGRRAARQGPGRRPLR